ncbi:MAG: PKD domain-containing protein [Odoribacteraceae bacterium]|jgi:PKD repeat protein|nr:PKD domain-containing protein [Odoribacteraceae bacterium]
MRTRYTLFIILSCGIVCGTVTSCLKEKMLLVVADFEYANEGEYNTTPYTITFENKSTGADGFEWTFEGGDPAQSKSGNPGKVTFVQPGEHRITLRAWNHQHENSKEIVVRVDSAVVARFEPHVYVNDFAPALVGITNLTRGATSYEWTFEGGVPASSTLAAPGIVRFNGEGEHKITLRASNGSEMFTFEQTVTLRPTLLCDFTVTPVLVGGTMEAPLTAVLRNTSRSALSLAWHCAEGVIADLTAEETTVWFSREGTFTVTLTADNMKEQKSTQRHITVEPNRGIYSFNDLHFGISQARNTLGCLFCADPGRVLTSNEITSEEAGSAVDLGFFALNSSFDHCYFFSPDEAALSGFPVIPGATATQINSHSTWNNITRASFEQITAAAGMDAYVFAPYSGGPGDRGDIFTLDELPVFSFFVTRDGRRGIAMIKEAVRDGVRSYAVVDIKIEKRIR